MILTPPNQFKVDLLWLLLGEDPDNMTKWTNELTEQERTLLSIRFNTWTSGIEVHI